MIVHIFFYMHQYKCRQVFQSIASCIKHSKELPDLRKTQGKCLVHVLLFKNKMKMKIHLGFFLQSSKNKQSLSMPTLHITSSQKMDCTSDTKDELLAFINILGTVGRETTVVKSTISVLHIGYRQRVRVIFTVTSNLVISMRTI